MSMPDKWEYPWFAAWDLAFQCVPFALVDAKFAKDQLWLLLFEQFQHPSGQLPAYEWEFGDLNPPVHAWAVWRVYNMDRIRNGHADREWLERCFHKLLINFASWVNKVDRDGNNVFEGGFLGLDNITVIDRSEPSPDGAVLEQSDATGWMGMFCLNLMRIALELARDNPVYEGMATKFLQHYVYVAYAMKNMGGRDYAAVRQRGRLLLRRAAPPRRQLAEVPRALARRTDPAVRGRAPRARVDRAVQGVHGKPQLVPQEPPRAGRLGDPPTRGGRRQDDLPADDRQHRAAAPDARPRARRARVPVALRHPLALEAARGAAVRVGRPPRDATSPPSRPRSSRAATRTGAGRSGSRRRSSSSNRCASSAPRSGRATSSRHRARAASPSRCRRSRAISPAG